MQAPPSIQQLARALRAHERRTLVIPGFRESAVLVPLVWEAGEPVRVLLTVRHAGLPTHAGQVAFPGGKRDEGDASLEDTALREAVEELGLASPPTAVLGRLDDVPTPAGFVITPVVAALRGPLVLAPSEREVTEVFYAPLSDLRGVYLRGPEREFLGIRYVMHEYPYKQWRIWGATATVLNQLLHLLPPG